MELENQEELKLAEWVNFKLKEAMLHKDKYTKEWKDYISAYNGDYFKDASKPEYKSDMVSNFVFSTIESIRPIMADNDPCFEVLPRNEVGMENADIVNKCLSYEFERENMRTKLLKALIPTLQIGTSVFFVPWNANQGSDGEVNCILVNPFNIFPDPNATCVEDSEYMIYAIYKHVNVLKKLFPDKAHRLEGESVKYQELATNQKQKDNQSKTNVLVVEMWCRDYTYIDIEEEKDGQKVKTKKLKYPNGRIIISAPELGIIFSDKQNPYQDGNFPFILLKDHDVPFEFWGRGEIEQILSPQKYINELTNQIIDNAKTTANMPWIIDKSAGIPHGALSNRPGIIIRKNQGSEVRRDAPPPLPAYVSEQIERMKMDIENISGIHDVTQGRRPTGIQAGNAIIALQEAGQARIRIKIKIMEECLSKLAQVWYSRMKQYWIMERFVRIVKEDGNYDFTKVNRDNFIEEYDINITSGSTMNKNKSAMLDLFIRLAQTPAEDGLPMIDRESVLAYTPIANKRELIKKFESISQGQQQQQMQMVQQQMEQQNMQFGEQIKQIGEMVKQLTKSVTEMNSDIDRLEYEHEKIKQEERLTDAERNGYEQGVNDIKTKFSQIMEEQDEEEGVPFGEDSNMAGLTDKSVDFADDEELGDDELNRLNGLPPEELEQIMQMYPELIGKINSQM